MATQQSMAIPARPQILGHSTGSLRTLALRFGLLLMGFVLITSAFGIWLVGGAFGPAGLSLMKLGVSLFMLISGMSLVVVGKSGADRA